jgi:hypothetical protein
MKTTIPGLATALLALLLVLAACASETGSQWTFDPAVGGGSDEPGPVATVEPGATPAPVETESAPTTEPEVTEAPAETAGPEATEVPEVTEAPEATTAPVETAAPPDGEPRVIELEADPAIRFLQDGQQIREIGVTPGETVLFRVTNTSGFAHNFYIGPDDELSVMGGTTDVGIPNWETGVQEMEWVVPEDISGLRFACTVPGHYFTMQGDFTLSP